MYLCDSVIYLSGIISLLFLLQQGVKLLYAIYAYRLRKYFGGPSALIQLIGFNRYAVITGSTDGIGLEYAKALSKIGFNILIIGRNEEKIKNAVEAVSAENNEITVKSLKIDFNNPDTNSIYDIISKETENIEVAVLVNNVGVSHPHMMNFENVLTEHIDSIVRVNVVSVVKMCQIFIPRMLSQSYRPVIINISSHAAETSTPFLAVYAASKAFIRSFSKALNGEYYDKNVIIQCVLPLLVSTKMIDNMKTSLVVADSKQFVEEALSTVGLYDECNGCLSHHIQNLLVSTLPVWLYRKGVFAMKAKVDRKLARVAARRKNE